MRVVPCFSRVFMSLVVLLTAAIGCSRKETPVDAGTKAQILHLANGSELATLDPHIATGVPEHTPITQIFSGLVGESAEDNSPLPEMAESWKISADGKMYTFTMRSGAIWTNGDPVTASDFVQSWERVLSPKLASEYAYILFQVKNAREFNEGKVTDFSKVGVKATDPRTLVVELNNPTPYFLRILQHYSTFPVHRASIEKIGGFYDRNTSWVKPGIVVGNGPFTLERWDLNKVLVLKKNPKYYDAATVRLNEVHLYPIDSLQTEERMFRAGQLHATYEIPLQKIKTYREKEPHLIKLDLYLGTYVYRLNHKRKPTDNVKVRRALAMSIDRKAIVENITNGGELPAYSFTPPGTSGFNAKAAVEYNPEKARKLLAEAGYPGGQGFPHIDIHFNTSEKHKTIAEAVQQMWKRELSIDVGLMNVDWKVYLDNTKKGDYFVSRLGWIGDYPDPNVFLDMWVTGSGNNQTGYSSRRYDDLVLQSQRVQGEKRFEYFQQLEQLIVDDVPIIPVYHYVHVRLLSPDVKGWYGNLLDHHPLRYVYLSRESQVAQKQ